MHSYNAFCKTVFPVEGTTDAWCQRPHSIGNDYFFVVLGDGRTSFAYYCCNHDPNYAFCQTAFTLAKVSEGSKGDSSYTS